MVASFRGSGVGEEPRDIAINSYVSCVLFSYFPFLNFRHVVRAPGPRTATSDDRRRLITKLVIVCRALDFAL